jgi:nicotinate-nucleotide adenylyltransferase
MENNSCKIALYGGTFNPPHIGHIKAFKSFCEHIRPDIVWVMPSSIPPHKEIDGANNSAHRYNMARIAFSEIYENTVFSALEISRRGKSYSIDTVNELLCLYGCEKLYMYIGSDMLFYFEKWKDFEDLFKKCIIVTAARCESDIGEVEKCCLNYRKKYGCEYIILPLEPIEISSTELRDMSGEVSADYLTDGVAQYIFDNRVYETDNCDITKTEVIERIRTDLSGKVDEKRLEHILSVEKTALEMAEILLPAYDFGKEYLADISAAALLHDITKNKDDAWHEEYLEKRMAKGKFYGYNPVYHSFSGAYFALENYFVNQRVFRAVFNHTTAAADMDIFEKIIYLADYIEPTRKYEGCKRLREKFFSLCEKAKGNDDLRYAIDRVILDSIEETLSHLEEKGGKICPELFEAKDYLDKNLKEG